MVWLRFFLGAVGVVFAASKLVRYAHVISVRTRLGGMFVGTLLVATATSAPELITNVSSVRQGAPNLAAGDLFGSGMFNMLILALLDLGHFQKRILRQVAVSHALTASLATLMTGLAAFFILARVPFGLGWVGVGSLALILVYLGGMWLIWQQKPQYDAEEEILASLPLGHAVAGFALMTGVLVLVSPQLVHAAREIAVLTGLGTGLIGVTLFAFVTSLPEVITMITAARLGAFDMTVGDLLGSNVFNMLALAITDIFYLQGRLLNDVDENFALAGFIVLFLINLALIGNLARLEQRLWFIEVDVLLIILTFIGGLLLLFERGVGL